MNNSVEVCGGRQGCATEVTHACNCGNPIVFLCKNCVLNHLSEPGLHTFISLEQAIGLVKNTEFNDSYHQNLAKYTSLKASIQNYIGCLDIYKENIIKSRHEALSLVEQAFQARLDNIDSRRGNAVNKLEAVMARMKKFSSGYDDVLFNFENKGLKGLLDDYIVSFEINVHELEPALKKTFIISDNENIYYPKQNTKEIMSFNITTNKTYRIDLAATVAKSFNCSSTCMLPDGTFMIVGGENPYHGDTYRYYPKSNQCIIRNPMSSLRSNVGLICHDKYLYAFGGLAGQSQAKSKLVERMEWVGNAWIKLPEMNEARVGMGIISMNEKIYLIGGGSSSIEYYNTETNTFNILADIEVNSGCINTGVIEDKIFIINKAELTIISKEFNLLEKIPIEYDKEIDSFSNQVKRGKKNYFYSSKSGYICAYDAEKKELIEVMPAFAV